MDLGPVVEVLGDVRIRGTRLALTSQQLSLLTFLASMGESGRDAVIEALWDGRPVSPGRFSNLVSETRAAIGRRHLPESSQWRYRVEGITTDFDRFHAAVATADGAVDQLIDALRLVRGVPFSVPAGRYWMWPYATVSLLSSVEILVTETALELGMRATEAGDLPLARWAYEQGLRAAPLDEPLTTVLSGVYRDLGKPAMARRIVEEWVLRVERLGGG